MKTTLIFLALILIASCSNPVSSNESLDHSGSGEPFKELSVDDLPGRLSESNSNSLVINLNDSVYTNNTITIKHPPEYSKSTVYIDMGFCRGEHWYNINRFNSNAVKITRINDTTIQLWDKIETPYCKIKLERR